MKKIPIKKQSDKKKAQLIQERELIRKLFIKQKGLCPCGKPLDWGSSKHEIKFRSHGGDPTDEKNTELLCLVCHQRDKHHIKVVSVFGEKV